MNTADTSRIVEVLHQERNEARERGASLQGQVSNLRATLKDAQEKLRLYRAEHSGVYVGGVEFNELMRRIDEALATNRGTV